MQLENEDLTRQLDLIPMKVLNERITIIGAGAIGSFTAFSLAKMGMSSIEVWDFDKVDIENMNCSLYSHALCGTNKVEALRELLFYLTDTKIEIVNRAYEAGQFPGIVIMAVDSMQVRKLIFDEHAKGAPHTRALIDTRMGAEFLSMFVIDPNDPKDVSMYKKSWYSDKNAVHERCTSKATIYTANLAAGFACKAVKDLITGHRYTRVLTYNIADNAIEMSNMGGGN